MTAAITMTDEEQRARELIELRDRLMALAKDGARVYCSNRRGAGVACLSGFVSSVTLDHAIFDVLGRSVPIQLSSVIEVCEHARKGDPVARVTYVERVKEPA